MRMRIAFTVVASLAAGLLALSTSNSAIAQLSHRDEVTGNARAFGVGHRAPLERPDSPRFDSTEALEDWFDPYTGDELWIDKRTSHVRYYSRVGSYDGAPLKHLARAQREDIADAFAAQVALDKGRFVGMKRQVVVNLGGEEDELAVEYKEYIDGVETFNKIRVAVDRGGRVLNCSVVEEPVEVATAPRLARAEAIELAKQNSGYRECSAEEASLKIARSIEGEQRLVWDVTLRTGDASFGSERWCQIDANSGAVLRWGATQ